MQKTTLECQWDSTELDNWRAEETFPERKKGPEIGLIVQISEIAKSIFRKLGEFFNRGSGVCLEPVT